MTILGDIAKRTLGDLGLRSLAVISMSEKAEAIVAFHTIRFNRVTGIAIVNDKEEYVGTMSVSDLKVDARKLYLQHMQIAIIQIFL
jgi:CBS domain-containing protein